MNNSRTLKEHTQNLTKKHSNRIGYAVALTGFLALVGAFASLADEVHEGDTLGFDRSVLIFLRSHVANPGLDAVMSFITNFGGVTAVVVITAILTAFMIRKRWYSRAAVLLLSMTGIAAAVTILKIIFARARPDDVGAILKETSFSFPSGHSMGSMGLAVTIILLVWPTMWRIPVLIASLLYTLIIGFSRLYLGVHYPTDVTAGYLLGAAWAVLVFMIFKADKRFKI